MNEEKLLEYLVKYGEATYGKTLYNKMLNKEPITQIEFAIGKTRSYFNILVLWYGDKSYIMTKKCKIYYI